MPSSAMLFIHCLTGLHPGSGTALGVVDLPIQRERHTQWPIVPGSSLKGVLRANCISSANGRLDEHVLAAFGPETSSAADHAGALSISDARLLAFPVRSLKGVFAWTTCQATLSRLRRDLSVLGGEGFPSIPEVEANHAAYSPRSPLIAGREGQLMLEEFEFKRAAGGDGTSAIADWIAQHTVEDVGTKDRLKTHLAILHDDDFTHFAQHATEVTARIGLDYERKTVRSGALFYEESLPPETLFYALVTAEDSRRKSTPMTPERLLAWLQGHSRKTIQLGGSESVGKGICAVRFVKPRTEAT